MEIGHHTPLQPCTAPRLPLYHSPETTLQKIYNVLSSTVVVTGIFYAVYYVYKKFIEPFLFGRKSDKKSTAEILNEIDQKMDTNIRKLNIEVTALKDEIRSSYNGNHVLRQDMLAFKNDLDAIKGLLLNRFVFLHHRTNSTEIELNWIEWDFGMKNNICEKCLIYFYSIFHKIENNLLVPLYRHQFQPGSFNRSERLASVRQANTPIAIKMMIMVRPMVLVDRVKRKSLPSTATAVLSYCNYVWKRITISGLSFETFPSSIYFL